MCKGWIATENKTKQHFFSFFSFRERIQGTDHYKDRNIPLNLKENSLFSLLIFTILGL